MDKAVFIKMNWHLRRQLNNLGWPGIVGLGLLAFCLMFYFSAIRPLNSQLEDTRKQVQVLGKYIQPTRPADEVSANPAEKLSGFYKFFPKSSSTPDWLAKIYSAAEQQNLVLQQGEYRLVHDRKHGQPPVADKALRAVRVVRSSLVSAPSPPALL